MRYGFAIVFVTAVLNAVASTAHAQDRRGFWIGTTIGVGSVDASAAGVSDFDRSRIGAFDIETGWAVNLRLLIGVEVNAFAVTLFNATTIRDVGIADVSATVTTIRGNPPVSLSKREPVHLSRMRWMTRRPARSVAVAWARSSELATTFISAATSHS